MQNQRGSAIIMLFVAVALFGALAYAFTRGSRTSTGFLTDEQARVSATRILDYTNNIDMSIKRLLLRGCKDNQISFENTFYTSGRFTSGGTYVNPNAPTDKRCHVFEAAGAGVRFEDVQDLIIPAAKNLNWASFYFAGSDVVSGMGTTCNLQSCVDMTVTTFGVIENACIAINNQLGVVNPGGLPPNDNINSYPNFAGSYNVGGTTGSVAPQIVGKRSACIKASSCDPLITGGCYAFYRVLIAR